MRGLNHAARRATLTFLTLTLSAAHAAAPQPVWSSPAGDVIPIATPIPLKDVPVLRAPPSPDAAGPTYTVQSGDTLSGIALSHGTTVAELQALNNLTGTSLTRGQVLRLPESAPQTGPNTPRSYTVQSGDTLSGIALSHGTTVAELMRLNALTGTAINRGQVLTLRADPDVDLPPRAAGGATPTPTPAPDAAPATTTYTVRSGDTLAIIAARLGTTTQILTALNALRGTVIYAGQTLRVPAGLGAATITTNVPGNTSAAVTVTLTPAKPATKPASQPTTKPAATPAAKASTPTPAAKPATQTPERQPAGNAQGSPDSPCGPLTCTLTGSTATTRTYSVDRRPELTLEFRSAAKGVPASLKVTWARDALVPADVTIVPELMRALLGDAKVNDLGEGAWRVPNWLLAECGRGTPKTSVRYRLGIDPAPSVLCARGVRAGVNVVSLVISN